MQDDVKFIFKSLIKVPVIIFEVYFVFNIFCLMFIFFKTLGYSYVVMQTVVENNYVPAQEMASLNDQLAELGNIKFVHSATVVVTEPGSSSTDASYNERTQYGSVKRCGVQVQYEIQWPLRPDQQTDNHQAVNGLQGGGGNYTNVGHTYSAPDIPITITYKVPGLQYYPDLNIS